MTQPPESIGDLLSPLWSVQRCLDRFGDQGMVIGGIAVSLLGKPRLTADIDAVIMLTIEDLPRLFEIAREEGLTPRISSAIDFARRQRVVLLRHEASGVHVDISLGMLPFEAEALERSEVHQVGGLRIRLPSVEDLIILKAVAHRPKDLLDIQALIDSHPNLDRKRIKRWVREFADALELPELWTDIAQWL
ncbi:MAG: nucleotidyltransferase [Chloroflexi bacterium]|nr:nucleotidyltransferase [Chloroflexota bacterium]